MADSLSTLVPLSLSSPAHSNTRILSACLIAVSLQLFRLSIDLIRTASVKESSHFVETHHDTNVNINVNQKKETKDKDTTKSLLQTSPSDSSNGNNNYGSVIVVDSSATTSGDNNSSSSSQEQDLLLPASSAEK